MFTPRGKTYPNINRTSGENIGDSGIIQGYRAWKSQFAESKKAGTEYLLPGLPYTRYVFPRVEADK